MPLGRAGLAAERQGAEAAHPPSQARRSRLRRGRRRPGRLVRGRLRSRAREERCAKGRGLAAPPLDQSPGLRSHPRRRQAACDGWVPRVRCLRADGQAAVELRAHSPRPADRRAHSGRDGIEGLRRRLPHGGREQAPQCVGGSRRAHRSASAVAPPAHRQLPRLLRGCDETRGRSRAALFRGRLSSGSAALDGSAAWLRSPSGTERRRRLRHTPSTSRRWSPSGGTC